MRHWQEAGEGSSARVKSTPMKSRDNDKAYGEGMSLSNKTSEIKPCLGLFPRCLPPVPTDLMLSLWNLPHDQGTYFPSTCVVDGQRYRPCARSCEAQRRTGSHGVGCW